ncbi:MAG TPA: FGGY-family carbohydrate kinase [Acidimicrobiales bacterium]|nr:FGGY-family carbohydrate kinase [Acidimicrobiales bacterium]
MSVLVVDVGTSGVRAAVVRPDATVDHVVHRQVLPDSPAPGLVEFDASRMAAATLEVAREALVAGGPVESVGIANQRASTVVWERATGRPVGPGIGWQDLRTVGECLVARTQGIRVAPNMSATKLAWLLDQADPDRARADELCFGTVDTWTAWVLSEGSVHVTDATNAGTTGLVSGDGRGWDATVLEGLRLPPSVLPTIVDSSGVVGEARALPGAPPVAGLIGDQQASLVGQGCTRVGLAKATFGTGGMLDVCVGRDRPSFEQRGKAGTFPIAAWQRAGAITWGLEAIMLSAGTAVEWLRDDLGIITSADESDALARACEDTGDVWFVPAFLGLGTPVWDFGARGTLLGLTRGTGRPEITRAVLEGVAHRGADLLEAAEEDSGLPITSLRVDGGMTANSTFLQALADASGRPIEVSPVLEATTLGAAFMAGMASGLWGDEEELAGTWSPRRVVEPRPDQPPGASRARWLEARRRAERVVPELSEIEF